MCKTKVVTKIVSVLAGELLDSFRDCDNDHARLTAKKYSVQHYSWYCVTFDGKVWQSYAHLPVEFVQAVSFVNGSREAIYNMIHEEIGS